MDKDRAKHVAVWLLDVGCVCVSYLLAVNLRFDEPLTRDAIGSNGSVLAIMLLMTMALNFAAHDNRGFVHRTGASEFGHVVRYSVFLAVAVAVGSYVFKIDPSPSRLLLAEILVLNTMVMCLGRWLAKKAARAAFRGELARSPIVMIVERGWKERVAEAFVPGTTYAIAGWLVLEGDALEGAVCDQPISCSIERLPDVLHLAGIEEIPHFFVFAPSTSERIVGGLIDAVERFGASCHVSIKMPYPTTQGAKLGHFGEYPVVSYSTGGGILYRRYIKRALDAAFSLVVLILLCWLYLIVAAAIKLDDPSGTVFFKQRRIGKDGKPFTMWKFRSMYADAEKRLVELQKYNEKDGPVFKMKDDPRITRVGRFIRKTSLDEMPQFFNVLKGDMSVVGPRPALPREVAQYTARQRERLLVRPGLTCYWQIQPNRDDVGFDEWIDLDLLYTRQCSLEADARIVARTVGVVLSAQGS